MEVRQQPLGARLHGLALVVGEHRLGLGEQVEDRQLFLGHALADRALLLVGQRLGQLDEAAEVLVDVDAAGVVVGDQLLDPLDQVVAGRVARGGADGPLLAAAAASRSVSARLRPANFAARPSKSICDRSISGSGFAALGGGADDVLLGADGAVEQRVHRVGDRVECRPPVAG